nr:MAG TPA: hypothetical protein [Caudoviricetes sp.]DAH93871.1 MAG TPA: hypothetical protein [Caudoviricetes sp.]
MNCWKILNPERLQHSLRRQVQMLKNLSGWTISSQAKR